MAEATFKATPRDRVGKGAARELRRQGLIPAVIYGDKKPPLAIAISYKDAMQRIYAGGFLSHVIDVEIDGESHRVIPRDYQLDPVRDFALHVDFLRIGIGARITVEVAVHFAHQDTCPGLKRGGVLNVVRHTVEVNCPADAIPEELVLDLAESEVGDSLHISAIALPEGVRPTITDRDFTIATIAAPSAFRSEAEEEAEEAEEEGEEEAEAEEDESEE